MRLWSLHPSTLDRAGLLGLWREALLAQKILWGGPPYKVAYGNHPQLERFKLHSDPKKAISCYLKHVYDEAVINRGYKFNGSLILSWPKSVKLIEVAEGQLNYELKVLHYKLSTRDPNKLKEIKQTKPELHPVFRMIPGPNPDKWERVKDLYHDLPAGSPRL